MKIPNIKLGFSKSKYSHNLSRDCNTTFPFGIVQPLFTQYMLPNSDIKVHAKQLVRLAPMPVPSFARVSLRTVTRFVPEIDVVPYADAFYAKMSYRGKVPSSLPTIDNPTLVYYLLQQSTCTLYNITGFLSNDISFSAVPSSQNIPSTWGTAFGKLFDKDSKGNLNFLFNKSTNLVFESNSTPLRPAAFPESADYVVFFNSSNPASAPDMCACFNFGLKAKNFRNICLGLGYSLDLDDFTPVRFSPLLSFYKAYYDTYGITRFKSFTQTNCFKLITDYIDTLKTINFGGLTQATLPFDALINFFNDLTECYYSVSQDFVSVHRDNLATGSSDVSLSFPSPVIVSDMIQAEANNQPSYELTDSSLTNISLQVLSRLTRFVNKNSILGQRLSDYMRLHYGSDVVSSIFKDSNFVDSSVLDCNINDVFSTSDTAVYDAATDTKTGENLGAFAGKGLGLGDLSFKYSAPCHGYIITLASIVPDAGYFQGNNPDLFAVTWEQQPSADFDALGFEATPRSAFISHNDISARYRLGTSDLTDKSFGFVPRFSGFKAAKNVVNGDMSRRGSIDSLSPYYLDHIISSNVLRDTTGSDGVIKCHYNYSAVPSTSYDWRYVCKYPWLGNFLRLFINDVGPLDKGSASRPYDKSTYTYICLDDPFICQSVFNVRVSNCLKPLSLAFDTYEEQTDNASKDVQPS